MSGTTGRAAVWLMADQQAVADAVSAALAGAGFDVVASPDGFAPEQMSGPRIGLLLHALEPDSCVHEARSVLARSDVPCLVVASTPRDHGWGAVLEAGAARVVDAADTSVEIVVQLLGELADGTMVRDAHEREDLLAAWHAHASGC